MFGLLKRKPKEEPVVVVVDDEATPDAPLGDGRSDVGAFVDTERGRSVPWRLYAPKKKSADPIPLVIFSHGLGGSRDGAPYLGTALAEAGYFGLFIQHQGSDIRLLEDAEGPEAAKSALLESTLDPANFNDRLADVGFVLDEIERANEADGPYHGRIDVDRIGIAGHSYGARTVLALAGQSIGPFSASFKDPRIRAALALSPTGAIGMNEDEIVPADNYAEIDIPILHVTGTEDRLPLSTADFDPYIRTLPFQQIPAGDQYLIVLNGAEHEAFSGTVKGKEAAADTRYTVITAEAALLFFDAYLKDDDDAYFNLRNRLAEHLDREDYLEFR